ncbi:lipid-A-disaccharide synthase [Caulobacter sp. S45]|uniref:lipid-A-disaccharide synthase n=1 Tax=Caulobacter sp. S45 TaxID=1641861 RepID=UPI0015769A99|nr:lipid-A-disaccharide synthase [Caulobacter sp. S45]
MLVAAEASGDILGAELAAALRRRLGGRVRFVGVGGVRMAAEGVTSPFDIAELSILGIFEGVRAYPRVKRRVRDTVALAARERPDIAVLIDSWGFTLRVAQGLRRLRRTLPLVKYVGPQVWASRPGRARVLARSVDHLLTIHGFDAPWFEREGLATTFVGNSTLARDVSSADPQRLRRHIGADDDTPILLVLPGSRPSEIARLGPPFEDTVARLKGRYPDLRVVVPVAPTVAQALKPVLATWRVPPDVVEGDAPKLDAMAAATVALACSGSVTTELALLGCPMVVAYRVGPLTYQVLKRLVTTRFITLFNIAADEAVAPEFIQQDCTGERLASALAERLANPRLRRRQVQAQFEALDAMGRDPTLVPAERAADAALNLLQR